MARRGDEIYQRGATWWLDFTHQGRRHQVRLGARISRTVAGELARVQRAALLKGEAGIGRKRADIGFDQAREEFLKWADANKRPRTAQTYRQCLQALAVSFAGQRLSAISAFDVERHKQARLKAGVRVMVNREREVLRALYNRCREWGKYEGENPVVRVKGVRESAGRLRFLTPEKEATLLAAATAPGLRAIILAGLYAGLRIESEALTLAPADVDLRTGLLTVQSAYAKSGKTRSVPMNARLRAALAPLKEQATGATLFVSRTRMPYRSIRTAFKTACRRAGLTDVTPHVLRHTFASRLVMAGVDLRTVQELGGWSSLELVQRYAHLSPGHKAEAVERISAANVTENSPTLFPTPTRHDILPLRKRAVSLGAPVAQVDRATVS
jgi:site-specific recombinase XerD